MTENAPMRAPLDESNEYYGETFGCHLELKLADLGGGDGTPVFFFVFFCFCEVKKRFLRVPKQQFFLPPIM